MGWDTSLGIVVCKVPPSMLLLRPRPLEWVVIAALQCGGTTSEVSSMLPLSGPLPVATQPPPSSARAMGPILHEVYI